MFYRIIITIILSILIVTQNVHAGIISWNIEGKVLINNEPLQGAVINLISTRIKTRKTDANGKYKFKDVNIGQYKIVPGMDGYIFYPKSIDVTVIVGNVTDINFKAYRKETSNVKRAVGRAVEYLISEQHPDGFWMGSFESDTSFNAYYIILMHYIDMVDPAREKKAVNHIIKEQKADDGWSAYPGGPGMIHIAVLNYLALKLAGLSADDPGLKKAKNFILTGGGAESANQYIQTMLALFGQVPWNKMSQVDTGILYYETFLYKLGYIHTDIIPLSIIYENYYKKEIPANTGVREIFLKDPWKGGHEEQPDKGCCQKYGIDWIKTRQEKDGNWGGMFLNTMQCLMALKSTRNPAYNSIIEKGMQGVRLFQKETDTVIQQQFTLSPVMDTAYAMHALLSAGGSSGSSAIKKAVEYLVLKQSLIQGDWHYNNSGLKPGGWGFGHNNLFFPDIDCTAMVLDAFAQLDAESQKSIDKTIQAGINWLAGMQNSDGGFSAFDRNTLAPPRLMLDLLDLSRVFFDYSNEDITSRAVLALSNLHYLMSRGYRKIIHHGVKLIQKRQDSEGRWYGRWLVNYTYGTGQVLQALIAAGEDPAHSYIKKAVGWLKKIQNSDGGWGETPESYADPKYIGKGESTVLQTAYVLIGLISAGESSSPQVQRGIEYLVKIQKKDGSWPDAEFLGTGLPNFFYCRYDLLSTSKSLYALTLYLKEIEK